MPENVTVKRLPYMGPHPDHAAWERESERRRWKGRSIRTSRLSSVALRAVGR